MKYDIEFIKVNDLHPYEKNAKKHPQEQIDYIKNSIKQFGFRQNLVVDKDNVIIIGHGRLEAAKQLGLEYVPCIKAEDLTEDQIKALRLADNKVAESEWDFDLLDSELDDIFDIDMSDFGFDLDLPSDTEETTSDNVEHKTLTDRFVVPPFSILDTRQGYWQDRKKAWKDLGIKSEVGRKENLIDAPDKSDYMKTGCKGVAVQTSIFDPVLAEIMYRWFNKDGGLIYDCFAGGSVRGIVASKLGYEYIGIDLRQEQVDANRQQAQQLELNPVWQCDDSLNADAYIEDETADLLFTCPPYADLEIYSNDARDISNMDYEGFKKTYKDILSIACRKLKKNRFAIIVIGDVRDKQGAYRNLIDYTKECMLDNGLKTYNEFILIEQSGTGALRAKHQFEGMRKAIKTHQNVLVFYKGDIKRIKDELGTLEIDDDVFDEKE
jgi:DNA modification methylase